MSIKIVERNDSILKSPLDKNNNYRYIRLSNGLKALLISHEASSSEDDSDDEIGEHEQVSNPSCYDKSIQAFNSSLLKRDKIEIRCKCTKCDGHHNKNIRIKKKKRKKEPKVGCGPLNKNDSVTMGFGTGSLNDPPDFPGLAHLLEHMLFNGSKNYPDQGEFDRFLMDNGGSGINGTTAGYLTYYFYEVNCKDLLQSLKMFADMFINPLIPLQNISKELDSLDSEFQPKKKDDIPRYLQILQSTCEPKHPVGNFFYGSRQSLGKHSVEKLREKMIEILCSYYQPNFAHLIIKATASFDELEMMVMENFALENFSTRRPLPIVPIYKPLPYDTFEFRKAYFIESLTGGNSLFLHWEFPSEAHKNYKSLSLDYIGNYLNCQCKGGLFHYLRTNYLITDGEAAVGERGHEANDFCTLFTIDFKLTLKGLENIQEVLDATFAYFKFLLSNDFPYKWFFEQLQDLSALKLHFAPKSDEIEPSRRLNEFVDSMSQYEPEHILIGGLIPINYEPHVIKSYLEMMTVRRVNIMMQSKNLEVDFDKVEPWFGTKYAVGEMNEELLLELEKDKTEKYDKYFKIMPPNPFIPTNFCPVEKINNADSDCEDENDERSNCENQNLRPPLRRIAIDGSCIDLWSRVQPSNKTESVYYLKISSFLEGQCGLNYTLLEVWVQILRARIKPILDAAEEASYKTCISLGHNGLTISVQGFSQHTYEIMLSILTQAAKIRAKVTEDSFKAAKDWILSLYILGGSMTPTLHKRIRHSIFFTKTWTFDHLHNTLIRAKLSDLKEFCKKYLTKLDITGFVHGNVPEERVKEFGGRISGFFGTNDLAKTDFIPKLVRELPIGTTILRVRNMNPETDSSSVIGISFQIGERTFKNQIIARLLCGAMAEPAFSKLRTEKALGYAVDLDTKTTLFMIELSITIETESKKHSATQVYKEIKKFILEYFEEEIEPLAQRGFENFKFYPTDKMTPSKIWAEIALKRYRFDSKDVEAEITRELTPKDVIEFYRKYLLNSPRSRPQRIAENCSSIIPEVRRLSVQVVGKEDKDYPIVSVSEESSSSDESLQKLVYLTPENCDTNPYSNSGKYHVKDVKEFQTQLPILPQIIF